MRRPLELAVLTATTAAICFGCTGGTTTHTTQRTITTTTETSRGDSARPPRSSAAQRPRVDVEATPNGATATGRSAAGDVDVNVAPNGGVEVDVQGEPIRERIRERRAAREAAQPQ